MNARTVLIQRLMFGGFLLANGLNHFVLGLWNLPPGIEPLAAQLMAAFLHSGLMDVAMAIGLVAGALLLAGVLVPAALCVVMPVSVCALYWSVVLEQGLHVAAWAVFAFVLNGILMLAYLPHYRGALQRNAKSLGET